MLILLKIRRTAKCKNNKVWKGRLAQNMSHRSYSPQCHSHTHGDRRDTQIDTILLGWIIGETTCHNETTPGDNEK